MMNLRSQIRRGICRGKACLAPTNRPGTTLIELLIYIAILALVSVAVLPLLFSATEDRLLQQTISIVEQNGAQLLQTIGYEVHHAERIVSPAIGASGSILTLQTGSGTSNPTIIGYSSGSVVLVRRTAKQTLSSSQVAIADFTIRNTSVSSTQQSVYVSFTVSRTIRLQAPRSYERSFEALFTLYPDGVLHTETCTCAVPGCAGNGSYVWQVCDATAGCLTAQTAMKCP